MSSAESSSDRSSIATAGGAENIPAQASAPTAGLKASEFFVVTGKELLSNWESSPGVYRFFAGCCCSPIYKRDDAAPDVLGFRLGTLDGDPSRRAEMHFMVGSKAPWVEINDGLQQEPGGVPFGKRD